MWELDCEESWGPKNWSFWTVVLEKTLESPLDCKEIQPVHSKGDRSWVFIGRTDAEAETPILWPSRVKSWLIGKDSDAGRDWGQEEKGTTEDEMAGWHHWFDGCEFEWTLGVGNGQGGLAAVIHGVAKSRTRLSDWTELNWTRPRNPNAVLVATVTLPWDLLTEDTFLFLPFTFPLWKKKALMYICVCIHIYGLPWWFSGKESACQCRRRRFHPWVRKIPWSRKWQPTPVFLPGASHGQRSLVGYSPWNNERVGHDLATKQQKHKWV